MGEFTSPRSLGGICVVTKTEPIGRYFECRRGHLRMTYSRRSDVFPRASKRISIRLYNISSAPRPTLVTPLPLTLMADKELDLNLPSRTTSYASPGAEATSPWALSLANLPSALTSK
ncbi:hypothetical protein MKEN_01124000 [Mycena kentingensis (nom. inval.)]|nr:hypothetical protein MKEN_01124000 [Mycena kentingensis (nom. inval.)]